MKVVVLSILLCAVGLAEHRTIQPNAETAPIRIKWADTRQKTASMFQLVPGRVPDLIVVKFRNASEKDVVKVESEVILQHKESGVESTRTYVAKPKKAVVKGKDGKVDYEDVGVFHFIVRQIRPTKVVFGDGSEWVDIVK